MTYDFECPTHGVQEIKCKMSEVREKMTCPVDGCRKKAKRIYGDTMVIFRGIWPGKMIKDRIPD